MSDKDKLPHLSNWRKPEEPSKNKPSETSGTDRTRRDSLENESVSDSEGDHKTISSVDDIPSIEDLQRRTTTFSSQNPEELRSIDDILSESKSNSSPRGVQSDHISVCKELEEKNSTFVFLYGASQSGKSCLLVSLLNHMSKDKEGRLEARNVDENKDAHLLLEEMILQISEGRLPNATTNRVVFELDFSYTPKSPAIPANFTFLEMSGESLESVHLSKDKSGKLPKFVDHYLNCPTVKICFIVVVPCDAGDEGKGVSWAKVDSNTVKFLEYIKRKSPNFDTANLVCVISKWDKKSEQYSNNTGLFMEENLGRTYSQLNAKSSIYSTYSIGKVIKAKDKKGEVVDFVSPGTSSAQEAEKMKRWLYEAVVGRPITTSQQPWYERLFGL